MYADAEPVRSITVRLTENSEGEEHDKINLLSRKKKEEKKRRVIPASEESENDGHESANLRHKKKKKANKVKTKQMYADVENPRRKNQLIEEIELIDNDSEEVEEEKLAPRYKKRIVRRVDTDTVKDEGAVLKRTIVLDNKNSTVKNRQTSPIMKQRPVSSGIFSYDNLKVNRMNADTVESAKGFQGNKQSANKWGHDGFFALSDDSKEERKKKRKITVVASSEEDNDESYHKSSKRTKSQIQLVESKEVSRGALKGSIHNDDKTKDRKKTSRSQVVVTTEKAKRSAKKPFKKKRYQSSSSSSSSSGSSEDSNDSESSSGSSSLTNSSDNEKYQKTKNRKKALNRKKKQTIRYSKKVKSTFSDYDSDFKPK